jgi:hypothetical protein
MSLQTSTDDSKRCRCRDCTGSRCPCCLALAAERGFALPADVIGDDMTSDEIDRQKVEAWFDPPVKIPRPILDSMAADLDQAQARAAALAVEVAVLRAAMIQPTLTDLDDLILPTCLVCGRIGEHRDEIIHKRTCVLARPPADPDQRGADLIAAADCLGEAVQRWLDDPDVDATQAETDLLSNAYGEWINCRLRSGPGQDGEA